ncbi:MULTISPECIES: XRE family transcriptional regulator [Chryseobacterium]|uniref:Transcriptional regulator with XRE-family HTH domain n=1 Tax=Chryseobacterium camelliae TaxID=1265445 RepID=A0ABU0TI35_9FLAO|nr:MULTISPECIES: LexA family transcriptional regulator [Chryseobacterium]MDT3409408.1 transcriptional regulator with XRE-family HTH domain [Pseudacidovorax intermedius]MDQ1096727.1 transcriptional regulator with XRE-family HTH domain [Chryseobacterium camelliae]MDQ1100671.1 transcriptional regulator with XRE-family HTH domain [Chryseobacterium sp. SORGH_AS_1048]MDR6088009.1 transcriptional regulator with XRE-family HTH domain [Chryseobacterium sp. SORGH_AS_0909]MDR6132384.1 transcriptional reg
MSIFSDNIRFLRAQKNVSQQELADKISLSRVRYSKYEDGRSEAPYELLIRISKYFNVSIDLLLTVDIRKYPLEDILKLPDNRIVLPVIVDKLGNNSIEIVPQKASMGYLSGYSDPEYIESLQRISLPFLVNGKYRAFPAQGDSMPPFKDGSYIIGKYVEDINDLKTGKSYVFVTLNDGISYKRFRAKKGKSVTVAADNPFYKPYDIPFGEIVEVWQYASGIFPEDFEPGHFEDYNIKDMFMQLRKDIRDLEDKVSGNH